VVAVSKSDDPERLLAEALRAQAVSTPVTMPPLPAVLTKTDEPPEAAPEEAAEEPQEAVSVEEPAAETPADEPAKPAPGTGEGAFTEEMVLRELSSGPMTDPSGKPIGRFVSIWRQEAPGVWRIVFDRGCQCPLK